MALMTDLAPGFCGVWAPRAFHRPESCQMVSMVSLPDLSAVRALSGREDHQADITASCPKK